jgi:Domain of unknown function (DUF4383)
MTARRFAQVFGAIYVLIGIVGFFITGFSDFAGSEGRTLILFDINPLHNVVHLVVGIAFLAASRVEATARTISTLVGAVYLAVGLLGLFIAGTDDLNLLALNQADNVLHLLSGAIALYFGLAGRREALA